MCEIIAGSCCVESFEESMKQAEFLHDHGLKYLRFMLWKPRTSLLAFQGVGTQGLPWMCDIHNRYPEIHFVVEIMGVNQYTILQNTNIPKDRLVYQIGTRNCQNYYLLKEFGSQSGITVLYKRGFSQYINEYLTGSKYLNPVHNQIILCLRGIRTFDDMMRNTPDLGSILVLQNLLKAEKHKKNYKIAFDPSHACGSRQYVLPLSRMALVANVDFLEIEIHTHPEKALSDASQTISFETLESLLLEI